MTSISVPLKTNPYKIIVGQKCLVDLGVHLKKMNIGKDALVITAPNIYELHGKTLTKGLKAAGFSVKVFEVPDGEKSKSAKEAMKLMESIARYDVFKKPFIVAFGGGVIGDLAGYVASAYKRGIPYVQVPTTFLAQIDSAIGGKVAIDLPVGKNLVGAFYQPRVVWTDTDVLKTLDLRQMRNGFAEAVKYGVIEDAALFTYIEKRYQDLLDFEEASITKVVTQCSRIKTRVVLADEFETKNIRTILNFGHTIGHAIEAAGKFRLYHHGESVALGMRVAGEISVLLKMFKKVDQQRLESLLDNIGLPQVIKKLDLANIMELMTHDKKFVDGTNRFVLAKNIGTVKVIDGVSLAVIRKAVRKYMV